MVKGGSRWTNPVAPRCISPPRFNGIDLQNLRTYKFSFWREFPTAIDSPFPPIMAPEPTYNGINGNPHPTTSFVQAVESNHGILEEDRLEPIAIIGLSLEFPQDATTPENFWKMLTEKRCAMTDWPKDRVNLDAFYHADGNRTDTVSLPLRLKRSSAILVRFS